MPDSSAKNTARVAVHEAGHAVMSHIHGCKIEFVDIRGSEEGTTFRRMPSYGDLRTLKSVSNDEENVFNAAVEGDVRAHVGGVRVLRVQHNHLRANGD